MGSAKKSKKVKVENKEVKKVEEVVNIEEKTVEEKKATEVKKKATEAKKKRRAIMRNLADSFKSKPTAVNGIINPLTDPEQKKRKRALAVAIVIEASVVAEHKKLSKEVREIFMIESMAASGILYKTEGDFNNELSEANSEASGYVRFGVKESQGENSYYTKYKDNVEACRKFSKALTSKIFTEVKEAMKI